MTSEIHPAGTDIAKPLTGPLVFIPDIEVCEGDIEITDPDGNISPYNPEIHKGILTIENQRRIVLGMETGHVVRINIPGLNEKLVFRKINIIDENCGGQSLLNAYKIEIPDFLDECEDGNRRSVMIGARCLPSLTIRDIGTLCATMDNNDVS